MRNVENMMTILTSLNKKQPDQLGWRFSLKLQDDKETSIVTWESPSYVVLRPLLSRLRLDICYPKEYEEYKRLMDANQPEIAKLSMYYTRYKSLFFYYILLFFYLFSCYHVACFMFDLIFLILPPKNSFFKFAFWYLTTSARVCRLRRSVFYGTPPSDCNLFDPISCYERIFLFDQILIVDY